MSEKQELLASQKQIAAERDQALAQSERLMAESSSTSDEQSQLAQQYKEILQERDGLKQELRDTLALLEKVHISIEILFEACLRYIYYFVLLKLKAQFSNSCQLRSIMFVNCNRSCFISLVFLPNTVRYDW